MAVETHIANSHSDCLLCRGSEHDQTGLSSPRPKSQWDSGQYFSGGALQLFASLAILSVISLPTPWCISVTRVKKVYLSAPFHGV